MNAASAPLVLLFGPSGVGKTTLAHVLNQALRMLHIDLDQWGQSGIDAAALRPEWNALHRDLLPDAFACALRRRAADTGHAGAVASFPSFAVLPAAAIEAASRQGLSTVILYGTVSECLDAFLRREVASRRGLDAGFWYQQNAAMLAAYARPEYAAFRVSAFDRGVRRSSEDLVSEVLCRAIGEPASRLARLRTSGAG